MGVWAFQHILNKYEVEEFLFGWGKAEYEMWFLWNVLRRGIPRKEMVRPPLPVKKVEASM